MPSAQKAEIAVRNQPEQKVSEIPISTNKVGMEAQVSNARYMGSMGRRIVVTGYPQQKASPYLKNNLKQKCDSEPALQAQGTEFKSALHRISELQ
jgi:hypothetical protein